MLMRLNQILRTNGAFSPKKKGSLLSNSRNIVAERLNLFFYTLSKYLLNKKGKEQLYGRNIDF